MTFLKKGCDLCRGKMWHLEGCDGKKYKTPGGEKKARRDVGEDYLKEFGAEKLSQTASGQEYLGRLRKKHEIDLLQPSDPRFKEYYGPQLKKAAEHRREREAQARREWERSPGYQAQKERERKIAVDGL